MKKIISLILALALVMSMSITAFAAETSTGGDTSIDVMGTYVSGGYAGYVVSVGISWGEMAFTYTDAGEKWNPSTHKTETTTEAGWTASGNDITVTNHSNVGITASFGFTSALSGVNGKFYDAATDGSEITSLTLARAEEGSNLDSQQATAYFVINEGTIQGYQALGTITVTIEGIVPTITGLALSGDAVTLAGTTYTITVPSDGSIVKADLIVSGKNLDMVNNDYTTCWFSLMVNGTVTVKGGLSTNYTTQSDGTILYSDGMRCSSMQEGTYDLAYSNDRYETWVDTGYDIVIVVGE